jgi:hypothetical protein
LFASDRSLAGFLRPGQTRLRPLTSRKTSLVLIRDRQFFNFIE